MARIERINKARKEQKCSKCGKTIEVGMPYLKATPYRQRPIIRCTSCGLKSYETSGSEYVQNVGAIVEDWRDNYGINENTADDIATALEEIRDQQQNSLDNMPENLQYGDTGTMLQERIDSLDSVIDELNDISWEDCESEAEGEIESEMGEYDPDAEEKEWESEEEYQAEFDDKKSELTEENYGDAIDEALSNLEY